MYEYMNVYTARLTCRDEDLDITMYIDIVRQQSLKLFAWIENKDRGVGRST
jgi:hypothetical protein